MHDRHTASDLWIILTVCGIIAGFAPTTGADIRLPSIIGDNMVLQSGEVMRIWGWADPNERITVSVSWRNTGWTIPAGSNGKWTFRMSAPDAGGPYEMTLKGKNTVTVKNILVGEVWVGSGQSNMEMAVRSAANAEQEMAAATYPKIRLFSVERKVAETPQDNCVGKWVECNPQTVGNFSAAAYYFGRSCTRS